MADLRVGASPGEAYCEQRWNCAEPLEADRSTAAPRVPRLVPAQRRSRTTELGPHTLGELANWRTGELATTPSELATTRPRRHRRLICIPKRGSRPSPTPPPCSCRQVGTGAAPGRRAGTGRSRPRAEKVTQSAVSTHQSPITNHYRQAPSTTPSTEEVDQPAMSGILFISRMATTSA